MHSALQGPTLYCTAMHWNVLNCIHAGMHWDAQHQALRTSVYECITTQQCTQAGHAVSTVLYCTVLYWSAVQHSTEQCCTVQYNTVWYSALQCCSIQYSTVQKITTCTSVQNRAVQKTKRTNKQEIYLKSYVATKWKHRGFVCTLWILEKWSSVENKGQYGKNHGLFRHLEIVKSVLDCLDHFILSRLFQTVKTASDCQHHFRLSRPFQTVQVVASCHHN